MLPVAVGEEMALPSFLPVVDDREADDLVVLRRLEERPRAEELVALCRAPVLAVLFRALKSWETLGLMVSLVDGVFDVDFLAGGLELDGAQVGDGLFR